MQLSEQLPPAQWVVQLLPGAHVELHAAPVSGQGRSHACAVPHVHIADALHEPPAGSPPVVPPSPVVPLVPLVPVPSVKSYEHAYVSDAPASAITTSKGDDRITRITHQDKHVVCRHRKPEDHGRSSPGAGLPVRHRWHARRGSGGGARRS